MAKRTIKAVDSVLKYECYADDVTGEAVTCIEELETTSKQLTEYRIEDGLDVAVVGEDLFTTLERSIFPETYDAFSPFFGHDVVVSTGDLHGYVDCLTTIAIAFFYTQLYYLLVVLNLPL